MERQGVRVHLKREINNNKELTILRLRNVSRKER